MEDKIGIKGHIKVEVRKWNPETQRYDDWEVLDDKPNLITDAGIDVVSAQVYGTPSTAADYIAVTSNSDAPASGDTSLTDEITVGGLARAQGTYAHSAGQATATMQKTFTATANHSNVQKAGLFDAAAAGNMVHETTFTSTTLVTNDQLSITWTFTIS